MENLVEIKNLKMKFPVKDSLTGNVIRYINAVNDVSLEIRKNEILGLVGESGSGKSTLGNCILRLLQPSSGEVFFDGKDITNLKKKDLKPFRKRARMIFQNPYMSLNPKMKIYDILKEPLIIHGEKDAKKIDEKIKNILTLTGLDENVAKSFPHQFSGGQRQRIAIANAIISSPDFIVADEPVSALDVSIRAQIINMLADIKKRLNMTMLFISHDLSVVKFMSDRIAVMYLGEIVELSEKEEFFTQYKHPYSKALLSSIPDLYGITVKDKITLNGDLPSPSNPPEGCKFHTRCPYAFDKCKKEHPKLLNITPEHSVRCFLCNNQ